MTKVVTIIYTVFNQKYNFKVIYISPIPAECITHVTQPKIGMEPLVGTCEQCDTGQGHPDKGTGQRTDESPIPRSLFFEWS